MSSETYVVEIDAESIEEAIRELSVWKDSLDPNISTVDQPLLQTLGKVGVGVSIGKVTVTLTLEW